MTNGSRTRRIAALRVHARRRGPRRDLSRRDVFFPLCRPSVAVVSPVFTTRGGRHTHEMSPCRRWSSGLSSAVPGCSNVLRFVRRRDRPRMIVITLHFKPFLCVTVYTGSSHTFEHAANRLPSARLERFSNLLDAVALPLVIAALARR